MSTTVASPGNNGSEHPPRAGYFAAIIVSALGHAALVVLVFFIAPLYLHSDDQPPPAYTVKIVDSLPAGDLGTHLPRLATHKAEQAKAQEPPKVEEQKPPELKPPDDDKNAIALNTKMLETPTLTPTPTLEPTPEPTESPPSPTPTPTQAAKQHPTPAPTAKPAAKAKAKAKATPVMLAKAEPTPDTKAALHKVQEQLLADELKRQAKARTDEDNSDDTKTPPPAATGPKGSGPVVGLIPREGKGNGSGGGEGSVGMLQDQDFIMYYQTVQDRIKKGWSFVGGSSDLTATVDFSIGSDGALNSVKIAKSSNDSAFDDSVIRAIRRAAPFPAPPDKYRSEFTDGIEAQFALEDLNKK